MKLSVKWLAGLAALALAVVAVVGSTSSTKAAAGTIFVANEWSKLTNESPAPTGYTATGTVYATYDDGVRLIQTNSNLIKVVIKDTGADTLSTATVSAASTNIEVDDDNDGEGVEVGGGSDGLDNVADTLVAGGQVTIFLNGQGGTPIAGANSEIKILSGTTDLVGSTLTIITRFDGSAGNSPWIRVQRNSGSGAITIANIVYKTSAIDQIVGGITVKSDLEAAGITIQADETGLSTAIFNGFIKIVSSGQTTLSSTGPGAGGAGSIRATVGPITLSFLDTDGVTRQTTVTLDNSAPTVNVTGPTNGSATQNRRPTFSGSIADTGAGLDISSIAVAYDSANDPANGSPVVNTGTGVLAGSAVTLGISTSGAVDGDLAFSFSQAPTVDIPSIGTAVPNHFVDWVALATDLAGNVGMSDANATTSGVQIFNVKIDQTIPTFSTDTGDNKTGIALGATGEVSSRKSIRIVFTDQVQNIQASDFVVTLDSGATVVPVSVTVSNNPTGFANKGVVYLEFLNDLVSNETPRVDLQDTIQDLAGNSTASGSIANVADGIKPKLTVTLLGGSGTGTGSEGAALLTKEKMTIRITSDEPLTSAPAVTVYPQGSATAEQTPTALSQGTNTWDATYSKPGSAPSGAKAVVVIGTDAAANSETVSNTSTKAFTLDANAPEAIVKVGGSGTSTSQVRPFITIDFADTSLTNPEASTVTVTEITLDGTDVTALLVASSNGKKFFITPTSDLAEGTHTVKIAAKKAKDAAGNENAEILKTFSVVARIAFERTDVFAGWNGFSVPSDPIDPAIDSVFTNAGHDAVLGFDPAAPGQWRIATRDAVSGEFSTTTEFGLTTIRSTQAYWVHSNNFESIKVLLTGETLPGAGSPPPIPMIPTVAGFNAIPVVDTSRRGTSGPNATLFRKDANGNDVAVTVAMYLAGVTEGRVLLWDPETLSFLDQAGNQVIKTGTVLFVEIIADSSGKTPVIFP